MRYEILVRALGDLIVSLSLAGREALDPDSVVKMLESVADTLAKLNSGERMELLKIFEMMSSEEAAHHSRKRAESFRRLGSDLLLNLPE